jgi:RNA polymerase sigma-70 factor (ECF subfamily)
MSSLTGAHDDFPAATAAERQREVELMLRSQRGDRGAYGQVIQAYQDRLYNAVLRIVGDRDEARDLTQEAFTKGLEKIDSFRGEAHPYTWLFRIATNLTISQLRKLQRRRTFSLDAGPRAHVGSNGRSRGDDQASSLIDRMAAANQQSAAEALEHEEEQRRVLEALGRLDAEYRAILVMRDVEGFDYQQMADVLGLPLGTLKSRLFRARLALRDELKSYMEK